MLTEHDVLDLLIRTDLRTQDIRRIAQNNGVQVSPLASPVDIVREIAKHVAANPPIWVEQFEGSDTDSKFGIDCLHGPYATVAEAKEEAERWGFVDSNFLVQVLHGIPVRLMRHTYREGWTLCSEKDQPEIFQGMKHHEPLS